MLSADAAAPELALSFVSPADRTAGQPGTEISIYLADAAMHERVEAAVQDWLATAGLSIETRDEPIIGSWFRRMWAVPDAQDAIVSAALLQNIAPFLQTLESVQNVIVYVRPLLIIKADSTLRVRQLTAAEQALIDQRPELASSPHEIIAALRTLYSTMDDKAPSAGPKIRENTTVQAQELAGSSAQVPGQASPTRAGADSGSADGTIIQQTHAERDAYTAVNMTVHQYFTGAAPLQPSSQEARAGDALGTRPAAVAFFGALARCYRNSYRWIDAATRRPDPRAKRIVAGVMDQLAADDKQWPPAQAQHHGTRTDRTG